MAYYNSSEGSPVTEERKYEPMFIVGESYHTIEGNLVTIIAENRTPYYECVKGDDGIWRYDRPEGEYDVGRVTGTHSMPPDPRNFIKGCKRLKHPAYINNIFRGFDRNNPHNILSLEAVERACKELDRLQEKLRRISEAHAKGDRIGLILKEG